MLSILMLLRECLFFLGYVTGKSQFPKPLTRQEENALLERMQSAEDAH